MNSRPMSNIDKHALREAANAANAASWGNWESYKPHKGARGYEVKVGVKAVAQHCLKIDSVFIAAANPAAVLALLDELESRDKQIAELYRERDAMEAVALAMRDEMRAADKRIAELEARKVKIPYLPDDCDRTEAHFKYQAALSDAGVAVEGE